MSIQGIYISMDKKSSMIRKVYNTILKQDDFKDLFEDELRDRVSAELVDKYFLTAQEKEIITIFNYLLRYQEEEKKKNRIW